MDMFTLIGRTYSILPRVDHLGIEEGDQASGPFWTHGRLSTNGTRLSVLRPGREKIWGNHGESVNPKGGSKQSGGTRKPFDVK